MSNVYRFVYDSEFDDNNNPFPQAKTHKTRLYVEDGTTWPPILWEFCKFLEQVGYVGVTDKVVLKDMHGREDGADGHFFQVIGQPDWNAPRHYRPGLDTAEDDDTKEGC